MGRPGSQGRRRRAPDQTAVLPDKLQAELATVSTTETLSGVDSELVRQSLKRAGRTRKEDRKLERARKKARKATMGKKVVKKTAAVEKAPVVAKARSVAAVEAPIVNAKTKAKKVAVKAPWDIEDGDDIDDEIARLEKKLGGNVSSLHKEFEDDGLDALIRAVDRPFDEDDEEDEEDSEEDVADDDEERRAEIEEKTERRRRKQDGLSLYGGEQVDFDATEKKTGNYVPPHMRLSAQEQHCETGLTKTIVGLLNRLSESNLEPITKSITVLFASHPRGTLSEIICKSVISMLQNFSAVAPPVLVSLSALIASLNAELGAEVGAVFLERLARTFAASGDSTTTSLNIVKFISHLYTFQTVSSLLVYDLIRLFISRFTPLDIEMLLALLTACGRQLRRDDPVALKEIILLIQGKTVVPTKDVPQSRIDFMLDTIYDLKNNKQRIACAQSGQVEAMRNWLRQKYPQASEKQLRISWSELCDGDKTGRWWMIGSAWKGRTDTAFTPGAESTDDKIQAIVADGSELLSLARARRMNTDVRRAIFCVVMSANDFLDAFEKLNRLALRPPLDREIANVLFDCCSNEKAWNPYYAHLAAKLCSFHRAFKFTFQLGFWDVFKTLSSLSPRQSVNLARLLAHLVSEFFISLAHLKVVEIAHDDPHSVLFFIAFFKALLAGRAEKVIGACFERISSSSDLAPLRDSIAVFFHRHLVGQGLDDQIIIAQRFMDRTAAIDAFL